MPSACRLCPGIRSAAEAASVVASSPSMISARRRTTGSSTTAPRWRETTTKTSPSSAALALTSATPKSCQAAGSYAASIAGICRIAGVRAPSLQPCGVPANMFVVTSSRPAKEIDVSGEVLRVAADAGEQAGLERVHPVQAQEVEPGHLADSTLLERPALGIEDRDSQPSVVVVVAGCPDDHRDVLAPQVEGLDLGDRGREVR